MNFLNGGIHHDNSEPPDESTPWREPVFFDKAGTSSERVESDLITADYAALVARWIDRALADRARLRRVDYQTDGEIVGRKNGNYAGILIPYFHPGSDHVREYWSRRDQPDFEFDSTENLKPRQKYLSPPGRSNVIIECEFKTLALWRLANYGSPNRPRFLPLGSAAFTTGEEPSPKQSGPTVAALT